MRTRKKDDAAPKLDTRTPESVAKELDDPASYKAPPRDAREFPTANAPAKAELTKTMTRIVESTFLRDDEMEKAYQRLTEELVIGEKRSDYGTVMTALDRAEDNARLAHKLMSSAKLEKDRYELEASAELGAMRNEAKLHLEAEKKSGERTKQITDGDVEAKAATLFQDEWVQVNYEKRRLELAVRNLEHQVENWASRCRTLQVIASKLR